MTQYGKRVLALDLVKGGTIWCLQLLLDLKMGFMKLS